MGGTKKKDKSDEIKEGREKKATPRENLTVRLRS